MPAPTMANRSDFGIPATIAAFRSFDMNTNAQRITPKSQPPMEPIKNPTTTRHSFKRALLEKYPIANPIPIVIACSIVSVNADMIIPHYSVAPKDIEHLARSAAIEQPNPIRADYIEGRELAELAPFLNDAFPSHSASRAA